MDMMSEGTLVTPVTIKSAPKLYRQNITEIDVVGVSSIVDVSSESACSTAYHKEASKPDKPFLCPTQRVSIRGRMNVKSDIKGVPVFFCSLGGAGTILKNHKEITLVATDQKDGSMWLTEWYPIDVGADDQGHFFMTNIGTATLIEIEVRQD
jgi:hypothetical protein